MSLTKRTSRGSIHDFFFLHVCFSLLLVNKPYQEAVRHDPNSSVQTGSKSMRSKTDKKKENYMVIAICTLYPVQKICVYGIV